MPHDLANGFDTALTEVDEPEPRLVGPWRHPAQMLAEQSIGGRSSIHDEATAQKVGFTGAAIEGPTHFSQLAPLAHAVFGEAFHERGCISSHYQTPVVEGEAVQAWVAIPDVGARVTQAGMQKEDGTPVLSASLSLGPDHPETELDRLMGRLREPGPLVILRDLEVGMRGAESELVAMELDQHMGPLYPFSLKQKLEKITEPCRLYTADGAKDSRFGRPIIPFEMISVLTQYTVMNARFPLRQPAVGLFANQEIRLLEGPLFVGEAYRVDREIVALSQSRRAESYWVRSSVREASSGRWVATTLLNSAVMKASFPNYEQELASLT